MLAFPDKILWGNIFGARAKVFFAHDEYFFAMIPEYTYLSVLFPGFAFRRIFCRGVLR